MPSAPPQTLLTALHQEHRLVIGITPEEELRTLSDSRALLCPECKQGVIYRAGQVRAPHFAHRTGSECVIPSSEPETEEHRNGKILLAQWLHASLPDTDIFLEYPLVETGQRADVLIKTKRERIALEYQCANLSQREWQRRHRLYRNAGYRDLWILGGSRLLYEPQQEGGILLRGRELERTLFLEGAPILFFDSTGELLQAETLARFRPDKTAQPNHLTGRLSARPLIELKFPWNLLDWETPDPPSPLAMLSPQPTQLSPPSLNALPTADRWVWQWILHRFHVLPENVAELFGIEFRGQEAFRCSPVAWQAALYYRFVHHRVGARWWLNEVEQWARAYLPLQTPLDMRKLRKVLMEYQGILAAAGLLSLPKGYSQNSAEVVADLQTLPNPPEREEVLRIARYRKIKDQN